MSSSSPAESDAPAAALMTAWGYEPNSAGTRKVYGDAVNVFIQDIKDTVEVEQAVRLDTMMTNLKKAESLAWDILSFMPENRH